MVKKKTKSEIYGVNLLRRQKNKLPYNERIGLSKKSPVYL